MISEIGTQVADIARTEGEIQVTKGANKRMANTSDKDHADAISQLEKDKKAVTEEAIAANAIRNNDALSQSGFRGRTDISLASVSYESNSITSSNSLAMQAGNVLKRRHYRNVFE